MDILRGQPAAAFPPIESWNTGSRRLIVSGVLSQSEAQKRVEHYMHFCSRNSTLFFHGLGMLWWYLWEVIHTKRLNRFQNSKHNTEQPASKECCWENHLTAARGRDCSSEMQKSQVVWRHWVESHAWLWRVWGYSPHALPKPTEHLHLVAFHPKQPTLLI